MTYTARDGTWTWQEPMEFKARFTVIIPQASPVQKESSTNTNPCHLQPMPSRFRDMVDIGGHNHAKRGADGTWTRQEPVEFKARFTVIILYFTVRFLPSCSTKQTNKQSTLKTMKEDVRFVVRRLASCPSPPARTWQRRGLPGAPPSWREESRSAGPPASSGATVAVAL